METRKVQELGASTLAVTLPIDWARDHGVEKGTELPYRIGSERSISFFVDASTAPSTAVTVDATDRDATTVARLIGAHYRNGAETISVTGELTDAHRDAVSEAVTTLYGAELVAARTDRIEISVSVTAGTDGIESTLRHVAQATTSDDPALLTRLSGLAQRLCQQLLRDADARATQDIEGQAIVLTALRITTALTAYADAVTAAVVDTVGDLAVAAFQGDLEAAQTAADTIRETMETERAEALTATLLACAADAAIL